MEMNDGEKEKRIREIDERIKGLEEHRTMWARSGGAGGRMAMQAIAEISDLNLEKQDLLTGSNSLKIKKIRQEITRLEALKKQARFFKKRAYTKELEQKKAELDQMLGEDNKKDNLEKNDTIKK